MTTSTCEEIKELNLSYLLLAQRMLREDKPGAMLRLGISDEEVADILTGLSISQVMRLAGTSHLMCGFRFDESMVWKLMVDHGKHQSATSMHAAILMADTNRQLASINA
ncbi:MAG: flagellar transcriptional regulator FlhD [Limnobacter sp.]|nr:flagellar transcriptional regulator FlhD [Limnobacter sp.]